MTNIFSIPFVFLMTIWAFSQLPSLLQRYVVRNNIVNPTLQNLINKGLPFAQQAPFLAARMEISLIVLHFIGLFGSDRHILRTLMVFNFIVARYAQSPPLQAQINSIKYGIDSLTHHPNCPRFITNIYDVSIAETPFTKHYSANQTRTVFIFATTSTTINRNKIYSDRSLLLTAI
jgi:hypothetical protein